MANIAKQEEFMYLGKKCYFWTLGEKTKPWICIIPGFTGLHADLLPLARELRDGNFVIILELPGWGKSESLSAPLTVSQYAGYMHALFLALHSKKVTLIGHCMGALIACEYALRFPSTTAKIFIISTPYQEGMVSNSIFKKLVHISMHAPRPFRPLFYLWRSRIFSMPLGFFVIQSRSWRKKLHLILRTIPLQSSQKEISVEENWNSMIQFAFTKISKITVPTHIIHGAKDLIIPVIQAEKLHTLLPFATSDILPKAGHMPPIESPFALATIIRKYL